MIGKNLKLLREANGFTQEQMASFLKINRSTYANYETGEREAPLEVLEKAGHVFGTELNIFFEEDESALRNMLVCAFHADNLSPEDMEEVARLKELVLNYLKINRLLGNA